jgi:multiple sugar transport system substrate-binding protein
MNLTRRFAQLQVLVVLLFCLAAARGPDTPPAPAKAAESKPAESKPAEAKPAAAARAAAPSTEAKRAAPAATRQWPLPSGEITINLWDSAEQTKARLYKETLLPEYKKLRPNVTINYESISTGDMLQKLLVALSTGTGPELFVLTDWFMPTYFSKNLLDPVPPQAFGYKSLQEMVDGYMPGRLDMFVNGGKLYAIPYQMNSYSFFLNTRLFKRAGLDPVKDAPKTWEDIVKLNSKLTKKEGDRVVQKGFEMRYAGDHWLAPMFWSLLYQAGGDVLKEGKPVFNQEAGVKAFEIWKTLTVAPKVSKNTSSSPYQDFADEQDAMMFGPPNSGAVIELLNPKLKGNYVVVPFVQLNPDKPVAVMYSFNLVVNIKASDDKKKVAWDFIQFATSQPTLWMERTRMINPVKGWYETPAAKQVPFIDIFIKDLAQGRPFPRTVHYNELQGAVARATERIIFQNVDPKRSLDQAAAEFARANQ